MKFTEPGSWNHYPKSALGLSHGDIMPMGYVADIERVRKPLLARLFGRSKARG